MRLAPYIVPQAEIDKQQDLRQQELAEAQTRQRYEMIQMVYQLGQRITELESPRSGTVAFDDGRLFRTADEELFPLAKDGLEWEITAKGNWSGYIVVTTFDYQNSNSNRPEMLAADVTASSRTFKLPGGYQYKRGLIHWYKDGGRAAYIEATGGVAYAAQSTWVTLLDKTVGKRRTQ